MNHGLKPYHAQIPIDLLEHSHATARGIEAVVKLVRANGARRDLGEPVHIGASTEDVLLGLVAAAAELLGDRFEEMVQDIPQRDEVASLASGIAQ
jgi:hypothetical protein